MLARLDQPGVKAQSQAQFSEAPPADHDPTSRYLFEDAPGTLRADVLAIDDLGNIPTQRLAREIASIRRVPFNDAVNESPHALASAIGQRSRRSLEPWIASSMRVKHNIEDARTMQAVTQEPLSNLWRRYKDCLPGRLRGNRKTFEGYLYRLDFFRREESGDEAEVEAAGDPGDDGLDDRLPIDGDREGGGGEDPLGGLEADAEAAPLQDGQHLENLFLMRQWLLAVLGKYRYVTLPDSGSPSGRRAVQILSLEASTVRVETYATRTEPKRAVPARAQLLDEFQSPGAVACRGHMDVFPFQDPTKVDLVELVGADPAVRSQIQLWAASVSEVEGCTHLGSPTEAIPSASLRDSDVPVLHLIDALESNGWEATLSLVNHTVAAPKLYDSRARKSSRHYFQCLLAIEDIFRNNAVESFRSGLSGAHHKLLLKFPTKARASLSAAMCAELLLESEGDEIQLLALAGRERRAKIPRLAAPAPAPVHDEFGGDVVALDTPTGDGGPDTNQASSSNSSSSDSSCRRGSSSSSSSSSSNSSSSDSSSAGDHGDAGDEVAGEGELEEIAWPEHILGQPVAFKLRTASSQIGLEVRCMDPAHGPSCKRYRSARLETDVYGELAAVYFLGAWLRGGRPDDSISHSRWKPSRAQVRAFRDCYHAPVPAE